MCHVIIEIIPITQIVAHGTTINVFGVQSRWYLHKDKVKLICTSVIFKTSLKRKHSAMYLELTDANQLTMYQIESQNNFVPLIL